MKITLEEAENLIDKIITLNTWLRITHLNIFKEPISFEIFNEMWWSPFYMPDKQLPGNINIKFGYALYLLHEILFDYDRHKFLPFSQRFIIGFCHENNPRTITVKRPAYNAELLYVDVDILIDYLGCTPVEKWCAEYDKLKQMALQNKKQ